MYFATAGAWVASLPSTRWKVVQPFVDRSGLVADAETVTRPASLNAGPVASVSPENVGPTTPMNESSLMICWASGVAFSGSPCESKASIVTLQLGLSFSKSARATLMPLVMLMPRLA